MGHDVYAGVARATAGSYRTVSVPPPPVSSIRIPSRWWQGIIRQYEPDICVLSKPGFYSHTLWLDLAIRLGGRRYVVIEHHPAYKPDRPLAVRGVSLLERAGLLRRFVRHRIHAAVSHRVIADSRRVAETLHEYYGMSRAKTFLVPWGVDAESFVFRPEARAGLRERWGLPPDALVVGSVSRLDPIKALERSIEAFAALRRQSPDANAWLVLAGAGPDHERLRSIATRHGVCDRLVMPGWVDDSADAMSALDVFLMPSREEGLGMALLEAMACERVCVGMDSGGPADILTDARLGWLTPADDQVAFTAALLAAAGATPQQRQVMGMAARAHVQEHFDKARQLGRIVELIATV